MLLKSIKFDPFEKLMEICEETILKTTLTYFLNGFEKEDIEQEALKTLFLAVKRYKFSGGMRFIPYYEMSLRNHMSSLVRKDHTQTRVVNKRAASLDYLVEEAGVHMQGTSSVTSHPEDAMMMKELITKFLIELSPFEEEVFFLFLEGKSPEMITEELNSEHSKVKNAMYRCSTKLRSMMKVKY